jgi:hypothetical protein
MNWIDTALQHGWVTESDVEEAKRLAKVVHPTDFDAIVAAFFRAVVHCNQSRPPELRERDASLDPQWFKRPWYYFYVQYFGTQSDTERGTFDDLISMLDYLESLGFKNLYLLPHYESALADGGYDVSAFRPREALGGKKAFANFMEIARRRGFCVATDAIFNHISVQHEWFTRACSGEKKYMGYFLDVTGTKKIHEEDRNGDIISIYKDADGTVSERICIFPVCFSLPFPLHSFSPSYSNPSPQTTLRTDRSCVYLIACPSSSLPNGARLSRVTLIDVCLFDLNFW